MLNNIDNNKIRFYIIFSILAFNFLWLSELRFLVNEFSDRLLRYMVYIIFIGIYFYFSKINYKNKIFIFNCILLVFSILFVNFYHSDFTLFSVAFLIYPFLMLLFNSNTDFDEKINYNKLLVIFNVFILFYAIYAAYLNFSNKLYLFNHNEISSFSFFVLIFSIFLSEVKSRFNYIIIFNLFITLFISYLLEARAIILSVIFIFFIALINKMNERIKKIVFIIFSLVTLVLPLIIVHYNCLIRNLHLMILKLFSSADNVISTDFDRYDMYLYVKYIVDNNLFGLGISNQEYLAEIKISGLHSGTLDLMYWGGYYFYIVFMLVFITTILYSYYKNRLFISGMILTYYLLILNYYEGFLFGNMGLLIVYIYMVMSYYNHKRKINC
ncbi:MAG: O-antigen ligase [Candidatus Gracilibacteria bacterium]|nr:O-antigen ligase [Candidatus Gracilibacteria bacterium]